MVTTRPSCALRNTFMSEHNSESEPAQHRVVWESHILMRDGSGVLTYRCVDCGAKVSRTTRPARAEVVRP